MVKLKCIQERKLQIGSKWTALYNKCHYMDLLFSSTDSVCLACYVANGRIMAFSLPSLKPLLDIDFLPLNDVRIARTFCFSSNGHASYLCSATEIQKITFSADMR